MGLDPALQNSFLSEKNGRCVELNTLSLTPTRNGSNILAGGGGDANMGDLMGNKPTGVPRFSRKDWVLWADWGVGSGDLLLENLSSGF